MSKRYSFGDKVWYTFYTPDKLTAVGYGTIAKITVEYTANNEPWTTYHIDSDGIGHDTNHPFDSWLEAYEVAQQGNREKLQRFEQKVKDTNKINAKMYKETNQRKHTRCRSMSDNITSA